MSEIKKQWSKTENVDLRYVFYPIQSPQQSRVKIGQKSVVSLFIRAINNKCIFQILEEIKQCLLSSKLTGVNAIYVRLNPTTFATSFLAP